jgi:uracil-DNA glycosylase family protein
MKTIAATNHSQAVIRTATRLQQVRTAAYSCQACPLWKGATQTVFGEGPEGADAMLIGEQPGHEEDLQGHPFVGPAGRLLDKALAEAGINRQKTYVTNVVKHFKWEPRGKRRLHKKPNMAEITACRPWLDAELRLVKPKVVVCLGATAAQSLFGKSFKVTEQRGKFVPIPGSPSSPMKMAATVHPSSILRAPDEDRRRAEYKKFVQDLKRIAKAIG